VTDAVFGTGSSESHDIGASKEVLMSVNAEQTVKAVEKVVECFEDGFQFSDILTAVRTAAEIAEQFTGLSGDEKKAFVVEVVKKAYREVDPDIPVLPGFLERPLENYVLDNLVPYVIELIIDVSRGKVKVNSRPTEPPG